MTRELRDYQIEARDAARSEWKEGITRTAIVHATGLGKSDIIASLVADEIAEGGRALLLTHRAEIMGQLVDRCRLYSPRTQVGQIQADRSELRRPITVAMVPTLAARLRAVDKWRATVNAELVVSTAQRQLVKAQAKLPPKPTLIIADECHHAAAPSWMAVLRWAGAFDHVRTLGVTATLIRGDKRGLGDVWESVADERDIRWAVENGWLVRPRGRAVVTDHVDLEHAKVSKGDYQDNELGEMVEQDTGQIVTAWKAHAIDRLTVAFCPTVASAAALHAQFQGDGVPAGLVLGTTSPGDRARAYGRLAAGQDRVLVNVMVATEGWDCPPVSCVLQARPTRLPGLYQQIVGRGLRLCPEIGKTDCLVLDVVGASRQQRLATLVDLHESAEYDDSEIEKLPAFCEDCELPIGPAKTPEMAARFEEWCQCVREEPESGPGRQGDRKRLLGPATYEDVDLFAKSELTWLFTKAGTRFLPAGDRIAILWDNEDGTYAVWHAATGAGEGYCLSERDDLDYARQLAESWALEYAPMVARRGASWRTRGGKPTDKQTNYARTLGIPSPETMTKPRLSDEISIVLASRILDRYED